MDYYEEKILEFTQKRLVDRIKFMENLHRNILPAQIKRIQSNDKSVTKELVLPEWMEWDLLYEWAMKKNVIDNPRECVICNQQSGTGYDINLKFLCQSCFFKIKEM